MTSKTEDALHVARVTLDLIAEMRSSNMEQAINNLATMRLMAATARETINVMIGPMRAD